MQLGGRRVGVEPVEGVGAEAGRERAVGQRQALRRRGDDLDRGQRRGEALAHLIERLHRDDVEPRAHERGRQLAGPGAQVGHPIAGVQLELPRGDRDRLGRVPGPPVVVDLGHTGELLGQRMEHAGK